ncbi:MAG: CPBP family intramembrane metalloprotease [Gemmatimonadota bacterium]|nr:CPBP family intramembrane metalloprotease [Gemmatimonadota bacterium]
MDARSLVFLSPSERKLRAPWRILIFLLVWIAVTVVAATLLAALRSTPTLTVVGTILFYWVDFFAVLAATFVSLRWVDGLDWSFVLLGRESATPRALSGGFLIGMLAIGLPSAVLLLANELRAVPAPAGNWLMSAARTALLLLPAAAAEEFLMRGYIFSVLRETIGWKTTLIVTSVVFGLLHFRNPGADPENIIVVIIAGFFLGTIVLATGSLYAAWMAHFAWNWTMAAGLHTSVSGLGVSTPNYHIVDNGPAWLTGGSWGPEGGLAAALGMFAFLFYLHARYRTRLQGAPAPR